jgi:hypothetical protein
MMDELSLAIDRRKTAAMQHRVEALDHNLRLLKDAHYHDIERIYYECENLMREGQAFCGILALLGLEVTNATQLP